MIADQKQSDTIGDNMDNINNPGYREEQRIVEAFPTVLLNRMGGSTGTDSNNTNIGAIGTGVVADQKVYKPNPGIIQETDLNTDVAIVSPGFFVINTLSGERYTRNGHFQLDPSGMLRTTSGNVILGDNGPIGPLSTDFQVEADGTIKDQGQIVDHLRIVDIPADDLVREGQTSVYASKNIPIPISTNDISIKQGAIEQSNVNVDTQMVKMVTVMRAYEANQKVIQTEDETLDKAVNEVGKV